MKTRENLPPHFRWTWLGLPLLGGLLSLAILMWFVSYSVVEVYADPVDPPEGYPKYIASMKSVTPTLAAEGGSTLFYEIEIRNTGAHTGFGTLFSDQLPPELTYNGDATSSVPPAPMYSNGELTWVGDVGFDSSVIINFSADVLPAHSGEVQNTAVISHPMIAEPVILEAVSMVTNEPILTIDKVVEPSKPGANKPMTYTIVVGNIGQPAVGLPITVTDEVPLNTTLLNVEPLAATSSSGEIVDWTRSVTLGLGQTTAFTFSVTVGDVPSGTVISNENYAVEGLGLGLTAGEVHTVTVVEPEFLLSKTVWPDPPGSNREMTYTLTLLNRGSLATDLTVTDRVPDGVSYVRGGNESGGIVSWSWPTLETGETAQFTFTVAIGDVADVPVVNETFSACSSEGICTSGEMVTSTVLGPVFETTAEVDPIAKKPGGGGGPVTPTLTVHNLGPGYALGADALLIFDRISVQGSDLVAIPNVGSFSPGPECGEHCVAYRWNGDIGSGEIITLTTIEGQNSIGGTEGTIYSATVVITDDLSNTSTVPVSATASGRVTHLANLIPEKSAPKVIGRGQMMTYTIAVWNSGLSTDEPPSPQLTDTVPASTTLVRVNDGGAVSTVNGRDIVSWTLPAMGPGDRLWRSYTVRTDNDLVSGTQIINSDYWTTWFEIEDSAILSNTGQPVTTTIREVGLIDSYKEVTPTLALPGPGNILTYYLHIVNSGPRNLRGVSLYDRLPWQDSTFQRDAVASAGQLISDIVSISWTGNVNAFSAETISFTVLVDTDFKGAITNTAVISHARLLDDIVVEAVAYITDEPVLQINKWASPDPVELDEELQYTIRVLNLGQQASGLVITDVIPANTTYVPNSASAGGQVIGGEVHWELAALNPGESQDLIFRVVVNSGQSVINSQYGVSCDEGVSAQGVPVETQIRRWYIYLPATYN